LLMFVTTQQLVLYLFIQKNIIDLTIIF